MTTDFEGKKIWSKNLQPSNPKQTESGQSALRNAKRERCVRVLRQLGIASPYMKWLRDVASMSNLKILKVG